MKILNRTGMDLGREAEIKYYLNKIAPFKTPLTGKEKDLASVRLMASETYWKSPEGIEHWNRLIFKYLVEVVEEKPYRGWDEYYFYLDTLDGLIDLDN